MTAEPFERLTWFKYCPRRLIPMWLPILVPRGMQTTRGMEYFLAEKIEIGDTHYDIVLLVGLCSVLDQVEFPEILLSGL